VIKRFFFAVLLVPAAAQGQYYGGWYSGPHHSSTLEEGVERGAADIVRSYGMASLLSSQGAKEFEAARSQYLDNEYKATTNYWELRRYVAEQRRALFMRPLSMEQYVRLAHQQAPPELTATQLDPLTGTINWPAPLRRPEYDALRRHVERLFQDRATGYVMYGEIQGACQAFLNQLQADIMHFPTNDYVAAKRFLEGLAYTARGAQS
jgi:hypothetical protein